MYLFFVIFFLSPQLPFCRGSRMCPHVRWVDHFRRTAFRRRRRRRTVCVSGSGRPRALTETKWTDRRRRCQKKKSSPNLVWPDVHCVRLKRQAKYLKISFFWKYCAFPLFENSHSNFPNVLREFFRGAFSLRCSWDTPRHSNVLASVWNFNGTTRVQRPELPNKQGGREKGSKIGYKNGHRPEEEKKKRLKKIEWVGCIS